MARLHSGERWARLSRHVHGFDSVSSELSKMKLKTFHIETWGCQMNRHDSERLAGLLRAAGLIAVETVAAADLVLLNTCSVREKPVQKLFSRIGELGRTSPDAVLGVCGCVAQHAAERLLDRFPSVAFVLGPRQVGEVLAALDAVQSGGRPALTELRSGVDYDYTAVSPISPFKGNITVIEGCDQFCSFCIVPYTRGRERSRPLSHIVDQARWLVGSGMREIELLGQTVNAYRCPETGADLAAVLEALVALPGLDRLSFLTSHPRYFDDNLIDVLARYPKLSRYLHLPFQAGADRTLARMNRGYTRRGYLELVRRIRSSVGFLNLSTDVIVGFPGETEQYFQQTLELLEEVQFGQVFAFAYSPRPRTRATRRFPDDVAPEVKKARLQRVFAVTERISLQLNQQLIGQCRDVLIEGISRRSDQQWQGRGVDHRIVNFDRMGEETIGDIVRVAITRATPHALGGRIVTRV